MNEFCTYSLLYLSTLSRLLLELLYLQFPIDIHKSVARIDILHNSFCFVSICPSVLSLPVASV